MKEADIKRLVGGARGAKKSLGQHFLINDEVVQRMAQVADIKKEDTILEIGPGFGILTKKLVQSPAHEILLVEKDREIHYWLTQNIKRKGLKIINEDALLIIPNLIASPPLKVISNLPYNISSPTIISLLTVSPVLPERMVLMLQKEVAQRLTAPPDDSNRGLLTVYAELFGKMKIIEIIPPNFFYPPPKVDSAVILFENLKNPDFDKKKAFKIIKLAFSKKRKKIKNSLFKSLGIKDPLEAEICLKAKIDPDLRPEDLDRDQWKLLIKELLLRQLI